MREWIRSQVVERLAPVSANRDPLFLFCCHIEWHWHSDIRAYGELVAALDDPSEQIRRVAEALLHRSSPRPKNE